MGAPLRSFQEDESSSCLVAQAAMSACLDTETDTACIVCLRPHFQGTDMNCNGWCPFVDLVGACLGGTCAEHSPCRPELITVGQSCAPTDCMCDREDNSATKPPPAPPTAATTMAAEAIA